MARKRRRALPNSCVSRAQHPSLLRVASPTSHDLVGCFSHHPSWLWGWAYDHIRPIRILSPELNAPSQLDRAGRWVQLKPATALFKEKAHGLLLLRSLRPEHLGPLFLKPQLSVSIWFSEWPRILPKNTDDSALCLNDMQFNTRHFFTNDLLSTVPNSFGYITFNLLLIVV